MNSFDEKLQEHGHYPLTASGVKTLQVNIGYKCNLACTHCHVEASPARQEAMSLPVMAKLLDILKENDDIETVDITGGAPEMNRHFKYFVKSCADAGREVIVRTNLAIYMESGMEDIPEFLAEQRVKLVASLPCYSEAGVDGQRGKGTFKKAIEALKKLNLLGYGREGTGLILDLMFNPASAAVAPAQGALEQAYRDNLFKEHGIVFNNLIALSNMPLGRLGNKLTEDENIAYMQSLQEKFNPATVPAVMCRTLINVSPEGKFFDCDFWQMLVLPVNNGSTNIDEFDYEALSSRKIVTNRLCFMCTAGSGASCGGALT
ncbi:MAG: arsenosugar biosynthesis radical SAM protein ArsS [Nitrospira sp.]|nr:arsenosugar biosynthesis radical SAM protein ArsS [bacterium]MBL7048351.1 arsenosugar biosynthesis radical SAM protein ArsS [Nitrospira sp.]